MSYAAITPFAHGDTLIDDPLIQLVANLDAIYAVLGDNQRFYPAAAAVVGEDNDRAYFVHLYRWLWVSGDATIEDPAGVETDVSVSGGDTEPTRFDTRAVSWLTIGKIYRVTGCSYSLETRDP